MKRGKTHHVGLLVVVMLGTFATPAAASPDGGGDAAATSFGKKLGPLASSAEVAEKNKLTSLSTSLPEYAEMRAQAPLLEAATAIQRLSAEKGFGGFTGTALEGGKLVLHWYGQMPEEISEAIRGLSPAVPVEKRQAQYSASILYAEARRLSSQSGVNGAGVLSDFSGVWIGVDGKADQVASSPREITVGEKKLTSAVKVVSRQRGRSIPLAYRWDDTPPFWGGGVVERRTGSWPFYEYHYCTTGFGARFTSSNQSVMTLSAHCGTDVNFYTPDSDRLVGKNVAGRVSADGAYLTGEEYGGGVYVGANNSSRGVSINGSVVPTVGAHVCYSGGFSGAVCNNYITEVGVFDGNGTGPGFLTEHEGRMAAAGEGDSGGPVLAGSTGSGLNAIGVVVSGDKRTETTCQGVGDRICSWRVFSADINYLLQTQNLALITVP